MSNITIDDLRDFIDSSKDCTGRMKEDNPLAQWEPTYEDEAPDWLAHTGPDGKGFDDSFCFAKINDNQYVACSPPVFDMIYILCLITRHTEPYNDYEIETISDSL